MKLALIGHGAMGKLVEARAVSEGHEVSRVITSSDAARGVEALAEMLRGHDAAIDFSVAHAVRANVEASVRAHVPLVEGTTGWNSELDEVRAIVNQQKGALIYGANFSIGVNLFYRVVAQAAELFTAVGGYEPFVEEAHHSRKRDSPSGTAIKLRDIVAAQTKGDISVASTRAGHIAGTHRVGFDSLADQVLLTHTARSREGFAAGALLAANWITGKRGVYEFTDAIDEILKERKV
ncbi:MAG TPA: dihydrodipicolinate reductase C-terminal domain-containing protein [Pyrinomonadaceae bacterium]|nr:dihydrodipicolinate reductase C-terminal domain-containing protein [Pyrinomonadaceae bacterium]